MAADGGHVDRLVHVAVDNDVAVITLHRPEALNAMSEELRDEFLAAIAEQVSDDKVRAIVVTGAGRAFCAGGDVKAMQARLALPPGQAAFVGWQRMQHVARAVTSLHTVPKVTIAAVNGPAAGLGCDLALCCDFVVASRSAMFVMSYLRRGLIPDGGGMYFLPRRVGLAKAKELIFTARNVDADEALAIGMADRVADDDVLISHAVEMAREMSSAPPSALALAKSIVDRSFEVSLEQTFALGASAQAICYTTDAHREQVNAFLQSRRDR